MIHCKLFGHSTWHRGRDKDGNVCRLCDRCLQPMGVLLSGTVDAGRVAQHVAGTPTGRAERQVKDNVTEFPRVNER